MFTFSFNTYQGFSSLWVQESDEPVFSWEGVTQGDPLVTFLYAVGVLSLIQSLSDRICWLLSWYADDSACVATLPELTL